MQIRRLRYTTKAAWPGANTKEGVRAAWWREHVMGLSRPELAERLGMTGQTIAKYEAADEVPAEYRLACAALTADIEFDWRAAKVQRAGVTLNLKPE